VYFGDAHKNKNVQMKNQVETFVVAVVQADD
jgi:hypothetical protein